MKMYRMLPDGTIVECADAQEWSRSYGIENRRVAQTQVTPEVEVSTVFLGIDHNWFPEGTPILFETMVFGGEFDGDQERYHTYEEAEEGHKRWVEKCRSR